MRSEHSDEQSAEQLQEVDHPEARIAHRGICVSPDTIFGSHRMLRVEGRAAGNPGPIAGKETHLSPNLIQHANPSTRSRAFSQ
jgi:hypothetical protein